jgi:ferrochelatase
MSPAFSSDCIETLEEINEEIYESFEEAGGETFTYIPCLNDTPDHIKMMMGILENELAGWA